MSYWRIILENLWFFRRIHLAVALGVAAATAVLTGALLVGDSVRGSLRELTLDRLGRIDEVLVTDRFFREALAQEISDSPPFAEHYEQIAPAVFFPSVTIESMGGEHPRRAANVLAIGADERFWQLGDARYAPEKPPGEDEIVLNAPLAEALGVNVGDEVLLRLPQANQVPADSPLGRKDDRIETASGLKVTAIIPAASLGRFALRPNQSLPRNAYLATATLQRIVDQPQRVNALLIAGKSPQFPPAPEQTAALAAAIAPELEDFGVRLERVTRKFQPEGGEEQTIYEYWHVTTDRMIFAPRGRTAVEEGLQGLTFQPVITYLANTIAKNDEIDGIPYSTISAIDSVAGIGPLLDEQGNPVALARGEIALNRWAAEDLKASIGDTIRIAYFAPETTHGEAVEVSARFTLRHITPLTEPAAGYGRRRLPIYEEPPTTANDPDLTPVVEGITDQASIEDWDPPFPFDQKRVRTQDDTYWENHRTTPKAFVSYESGQAMWGSRFGDVTSFRLPADQPITEDELRERLTAALRKHQQALGFTLLPVKRQGLAASSGTTPFDVLFLFLSFFIIAAALLLVSVLFKLGVDQRATEIGTLLALGWQRHQTGRTLLAEGLLVSAIGGILGVLLGVGYAWLMLAGLRTWWVGAISTPFLNLYVTPVSLVIGLVSGVIVSALTIAWSLRQLRRVSTRQLLSGQTTPPATVRRRSPYGKLAVALMLAGAVVLAMLAPRLGGEAQAGAFVGAGAAVLVALLLLVWNALRLPRAASPFPRMSLGRLAVGAAQRNPSRSTLTIGLMAAACFLIVAMGLFRLDPTPSGTGGFDLVATTSDPIFADLNTPAGREDLFGERANVLDGATIFGLRYRPGDDASCTNLYQATQPRIIGVTPEFIERNAPFQWSASAATLDSEKKNPWLLLAEAPAPADEPIPVVIDKNTAMYSLHLYGGIGEEFNVTYEDGTELRFRVVGLLSNSILQGSLIIGEADFLQRFPATSGYRYFLVQAPPDKLADVRTALADRLSDQGFDPQSATELLTELLRVQNTYLSTFQSLGALGLLLGTFGLATVQLRSVLERRAELALLRAQGFAQTRVARLVLTECLLLLVGGLASGVVAALVAVLPHVILSGTPLRFDQLALMLGLILVVGLLSSLLAVRATVKADIIGALRGE